MSDLDLSKYAPASDELLASFRRSIVEMREHEHPREDYFCLNLASYMGDRMGVVLRRLADAEAEVERLAANVSKLLASKGTSWADGYETGCGMSHALGCDATTAQRDALVEEVERLRLENANLTVAIDGGCE